MEISLNERLQKARLLKAAGNNCAQCVMMSFNDVTGLPDELAARLAGALGGGVGGLRQTCGAVTTMAIVTGTRYFHTPADKAPTYARVRTLADEFKQKNGSTICAELKADTSTRKTCMEYIEDAITILHNHLCQAQCPDGE